MNKLLRALAAIVLVICANGWASAQTINLTPAQLAIPAVGTGLLTVTLSQPATGDTVITVNSSDPTLLLVPGTVTVANGNVSTTIQVTALVDAGTATVTATYGSSVASSQVTIGTSRSITVSPPNVAIPSFGSTTLTASLSSPAPAGGLTLSVDASPTGTVQIPAAITVQEGSSSVSFTLTAVVSTGVVTVSVSDGQAVGTAVVTIGPVTPAQCQIAVNNALAAADAYRSKLQQIPSVCTQPSNACSAQVADAEATLSQLSKLQRAVKVSCTRPPR